MVERPDPTDDILNCQRCGDAVRHYDKEEQRGVWMRRDGGNSVYRELLCLDCAIDEKRNPDFESRSDVGGNFLMSIYDTPDPRLDGLVERYDNFNVIDGDEAAERLGVTPTTFGEWVEVDPRFDYGTSPRSPWVDMESYRKFHR